MRKRNIVKVVSITAIAFCLGFFVNWHFWEIQMSEKQYEECEEIVRIYKEEGRINASEEFLIEIDSTTISVESSNPCCRGEVFATLDNDEIERIPETGYAVVNSIGLGIVFIVISLFIVDIIERIIAIFRKK